MTPRRITATSLIAMMAVALVAATAAEQSGETLIPAERFWPQWRGPHATGVSRRPTRRSSGAKRRTSAGRSRFPAADPRRPLCGAIASSCCRPFRSGVTGATRARAARRPRSRATSSLRRPRHRSSRPARRLGANAPREEQPHEARHQDNGTWASSSAITDGQRVFAWFESRGMYAYDMNGKLALAEGSRRQDDMRNEFGEGSTPALYGNRLVIVWDHRAASRSSWRSTSAPARSSGA